jgi:hypothetical protein
MSSKMTSLENTHKGIRSPQCEVTKKCFEDSSQLLFLSRNDTSVNNLNLKIGAYICSHVVGIATHDESLRGEFDRKLELNEWWRGEEK